MSGSQQLLLGGSVQQAVDPYFYSVTSLLHGDGTNGGQNNTFLDSSSNNFTITRNGNTTQGSFSPFSQTGWSNYFDGSGDYLTAPSNAAFNISTGDYTFECWVYKQTSSRVMLVAIASAGLSISISASGNIEVNRSLIAIDFTFTAGVPNNQWTHIAVSRSGTSLRAFMNGVLLGTQTSSTSYGQGICYIGIDADASSTPYLGYISNARLVKGTAVYTAAFTPPTTPLTAISGTSLLTCQANRFLDASSNNFTITRNGDVSVQPFSPFNPTTPYSTSAVGGSGYFDGSGDFLQVADAAPMELGSGNWTIEMWVNTLNNTAYSALFTRDDGGTTTGSYVILLNTTSANGIVTFWSADVNSFTAAVLSSGTTSCRDGAWHHIAVVRNSNTLTMYIDGTATSTASFSGSFGNTAQPLKIGSETGYSRDYTGYISNVRLVVGTAVYTSNFTPPTAPLTAITNTSLLCNFTNGAIFDNAAVADYETVGNAQISTSVKKYGTGSLAFDGTGDYLLSPGTQNLTFGTGDFTIEFWLYLNVLNADQLIYDTRPASTQGAYPVLYFSNGNSSLNFFTDGTNRITSSVTSGIWYHVAVCRAASQTKMFINGTQVGSTYADTTNYLCNRLVVGASSFSLGSGSLNGYIDDLRISKGIARYTYNFTPPTAELPNIGGTVTLTADPYFDYTTLLLPGNGTNGAQNNTFLDSSTNAFSITRNGNTTQGTFSPFSQTGWGNYFDGNGDYLSVASNAALSWGTGDYTVECWVYLTAATSRIMVVTGTGNFVFFTNGSNQVVVGRVGTDELVSTTTVTLNAWNHIAATRASNTTRIFINGVSAVTPASITTNYGQNTVSIGSDGVNHTTGYISNFRAIKGTALYTADFTPPTTPLTAITNTSLLTCQSNRFIDNSTNNFTITRNGDVSVQAFSPFNPTAAWSAATNGGSGYFDGSGDYLTAPSDAAFALSGDFSMECWAYFTGATAVGGGPSGELLYAADVTGGAVICVRSGTLIALSAKSVADDLSASVTFTPGQWYHLVAARTGTTAVLYVSGTRVATGTVSRSYAQGGFSTQSGFNGYLTSVRIVKGSNPYGTGTTITVPTAPLTAITNTSLLLNYTNAGIYDATSKNDLETVGNAQISTTQSKFGGSSMYFDGTGDWLAIPATQNIVFGTADFTIEMWVYSGSQSSTSVRMMGNGAGGSWASGKYILTTTTAANPNKFTFGVNNTSPVDLLVSTTTFNDSTWRHVAITRYGNVFRLFVNGIQESTNTSSASVDNGTAVQIRIGSGGISGDADWAGYIDDLRITKGIARYTSNFTPPTTAFLTQ